MFSIEFSNQSKRFLKNLNSDIFYRIIRRIEKLKQNPISSDTKFIGREKGDKIFRYRVGNYRALYKLKEKEKIILITKIDKRTKVYK